MAQPGSRSPAGTFGRSSDGPTPRSDTRHLGISASSTPASPAAPLDRNELAPTTHSGTTKARKQAEGNSQSLEGAARAPSPLDPRQHWRGDHDGDGTASRISSEHGLRVVDPQRQGSYSSVSEDEGATVPADVGAAARRGHGNARRTASRSGEGAARRGRGGFGFGERGGIDSISALPSASPEVGEARKRFSAERARLFAEQTSNHPSELGIDSPASRSSIVASSRRPLAFDAAPERRTSRPSTSDVPPLATGHNNTPRVLRSLSTAARQVRRDARARSYPEGRRSARALSAPDDYSRQRMSFAPGTLHIADGGHEGDDESDPAAQAATDGRGRGRHRVQSAPGQLPLPSSLRFESSPMVRTSGSQGTNHAARAHDTQRLSLDLVAARQRTMSDAYATALRALAPRFPEACDVPFAQDLQQPQGWRRTRAWLGRSLLPLRVLIPVAVSLFLDFNVLFVVAEVAISSKAVSADNSNAAWWVAFGIYLFCPVAAFVIFLTRLLRAWSQSGRTASLPAVQIYLSDIGRLVQMVRSEHLYTLIRRIDQRATTKQSILELCWRIQQSWPFALLCAPRLTIAVVVLILYGPHSSGQLNAGSLDSFFFDSPTNSLSEYGFATILAAVVWLALGASIVLLASALVFLLSRQRSQLVDESYAQHPSGAHTKTTWLLGSDEGTSSIFGLPTWWQSNTEDRIRAALLQLGEHEPALHFEMVNTIGSNVQSSAVLPTAPQALTSGATGSTATQSPSVEGRTAPPAAILGRNGAGTGARAHGGLASTATPAPALSVHETAQMVFPTAADARRNSSHSGPLQFQRRAATSTEIGALGLMARPTRLQAQSMVASDRGPEPSLAGNPATGTSSHALAPTASSRPRKIGRSIDAERRVRDTSEELHPQSLGPGIGHSSRPTSEDLMLPRQTQRGSDAAVSIEARRAPTEIQAAQGGQVDGSEGSASVAAETTPSASRVISSLSPPLTGLGIIATEHIDAPRDSAIARVPAAAPVRLGSSEGDANMSAVADTSHGSANLSVSDHSSDDSEERRLYATFPDASRRHPPGLIILELQQQREEALRRESSASRPDRSAAAVSRPFDLSSFGVVEDTPQDSPGSEEEFPMNRASRSVRQAEVSPSSGRLVAITEESSTSAGSLSPVR